MFIVSKMDNREQLSASKQRCEFRQLFIGRKKNYAQKNKQDFIAYAGAFRFAKFYGNGRS